MKGSEEGGFGPDGVPGPVQCTPWTNQQLSQGRALPGTKVHGDYFNLLTEMCEGLRRSLLRVFKDRCFDCVSRNFKKSICPLTWALATLQSLCPEQVGDTGLGPGPEERNRPVTYGGP